MAFETVAQTNNVVQVLAPATDAAGRTGSYVSLKNALRATFVFSITQGNAATIALSFVQAKDVSGTGSKAFSVASAIWYDIDTATSDVLTRATDSSSYTTDAGVKNKIVVVEIRPADLDLANGFAYIAPVTGASNIANITSCTALIFASYGQGTMASARV